MAKYEQLNFFREQRKKEKADSTMEEPPKIEESPAVLSEKEEQWLIEQQEGKGSRLITGQERKEKSRQAKKSLEELRKQLFSKQKKLNLKKGQPR